MKVNMKNVAVQEWQKMALISKQLSKRTEFQFKTWSLLFGKQGFFIIIFSFLSNAESTTYLFNKDANN